eukprot:2143720-Rhodomonas_salina.2
MAFLLQSVLTTRELRFDFAVSVWGRNFGGYGPFKEIITHPLNVPPPPSALVASLPSSGGQVSAYACPT